MKAVYIVEPGGPEKLIYGDRPDPEAGPGEVVIHPELQPARERRTF